MRYAILAIIVAIILVQAATSLADVRDTAREVVASHEDAVVTIEVVTEQKFSYGGRQNEREIKNETLGMVIDEKGTVVTALSSVDQNILFQKMNAGQEDDSFSSRIKDLKYLMPDNTEVQATVVLRDVELDVAVLRPVEMAEEPFTYFDISSNAEPVLLEEVFGLGRLGKIGRREIIAMTGEVQSIVERPRPFYVTDAEVVSGGSGSPVFNESGNLIGMVVLRVLPGGTETAQAQDELFLQIILPTVDVKEVVDQAPPFEEE